MDPFDLQLAKRRFDSICQDSLKLMAEAEVLIAEVQQERTITKKLLLEWEKFAFEAIKELNNLLHHPQV